MVKITNILPTRYLFLLKSFDLNHQIHLLLAHQTLKDKNYVDFYLERKKQGDYIVLDNSAFEFGEAMTAGFLKKTIHLIRPHEFVLPDVLFDKHQTIKRSADFAKNLSSISMNYMGVVQGNTLEEWLSCYDYFSNSDQIYSIGLGAIYSPRTVFNNKLSDFVSGREFLISKLQQNKLLNTNKPHHLLGLGDSGHLEINKLSKYKWIRSCDSSAAYIQAKHGVKIIAGQEYSKIKNKINLNDKIDQKDVDMIIYNMQTLYETGNRR